MVDHRDELERGLAGLDISCTAGQLEQLLAYQALLEKWNESYNLVANGELDQFVARHLLDSLAIVPELAGARVIVDVGSGGGLPGIPLAIVNPDIEFVLLDSNGKKTRFLFQTKVALQLANVQVENCRVEHYQSPRQIDIVTCRAFSTLAELLHNARQCFHDGTRLVAMKGRYPEQEIAQLPPPFRVVNTRKLSIPGNNSERHVIVVKMRDTAAE